MAASTCVSSSHSPKVGPGEDIEQPLQELLGDPAVDEVHVRTLAAQCFTDRVRAAGR